MAFFTALLVVLTLTGKPVVSALCVTWCDTSSETLNCREEAIAPTSAAELTAAETACATFVTTVPEDARGVGQVAVEDVNCTIWR